MFESSVKLKGLVKKERCKKIVAYALTFVSFFFFACGVTKKKKKNVCVLYA